MAKKRGGDKPSVAQTIQRRRFEFHGRVCGLLTLARQIADIPSVNSDAKMYLEESIEWLKKAKEGSRFTHAHRG